MLFLIVLSDILYLFSVRFALCIYLFLLLASFLSISYLLTLLGICLLLLLSLTSLQCLLLLLSFFLLLLPCCLFVGLLGLACVSSVCLYNLPLFSLTYSISLFWCT